MKKIAALLLAALSGALVVYAYVRKQPSVSPQVAATVSTEPRPAVRKDQPAATDRSVSRPALRDATAEHMKELETFAASLKNKVIVNFGTVSEVGENTSLMMTTRSELRSLKKIPEAERSAEQSRRIQQLERVRATTLGMLPEVASFQDQPEHYGDFYSSLLKAAAGLDPAQTARVKEYMTGRGQLMVSQHFNAANEPTDPDAEAAWESRRDAFNQETAKGAAALLPPGMAETVGFTPGFLELMEQDFDKAD